MFTLNLVTPHKRLVTGAEIEEVIVPGYRGELDILPGHAPLVTTLNTGVLRYRLKGSPVLQAVVVSWGYCEVSAQGVNVLAETAEALTEIDAERAQMALDRATRQLKEAAFVEEREKYLRKVERARVRLEVVGGGKGSKTSTTH